MVRIPLFLLFIFFSSFSSAFAGERLRFQAIETNKENRILDFAQKKVGQPSNQPEIAKKDLNNDVIDEFIVRYNCGQRSCNHLIIALQELNPIIIGQFDAHKILISQKKTYGIYDLIIYNSQYNDFTNDIARWNPFLFQYKLD